MPLRRRQSEPNAIRRWLPALPGAELSRRAFAPRQVRTTQTTPMIERMIRAELYMAWKTHSSVRVGTPSQ